MLVHLHMDATIAADLAALTGDIARRRPGQASFAMQACGNTGIGAAGHRVFRNAVAGAEGAHDQVCVTIVHGCVDGQPTGGASVGQARNGGKVRGCLPHRPHVGQLQQPPVRAVVPERARLRAHAQASAGNTQRLGAAVVRVDGACARRAQPHQQGAVPVEHFHRQHAGRALLAQLAVASVGDQAVSHRRPGRAHAGVPGKRWLGARREDADVVIRIGHADRREKDRLRQIQPRANLLHLLGRQCRCIEDHAQRIAAAGLAGEHIQLQVTVLTDGGYIPSKEAAPMVAAQTDAAVEAATRAL